MKRNFIICSLLTVAMLLVPLAVMKKDTDKPVSGSTETFEDTGYISVMKSENGKVEKLSQKEYIVGVLAAETDMNYHDEALKAQAVASYTYALYMKRQGDKNDLNGADLSDDPQIHQGYLDEAQRKEKWGDDFEINETKAGKIADSVLGKVILYENEPILAVYHDFNSGKTESAATVWKKEIPYLVQVESAGDKLCTSLVSENNLSYDEFRDSLSGIDGVVFDADKKEWIGDIEKTESGYVLNVEICSNKVSSRDFRDVLGLKSCCFDVKSNEDGVEITVKGNGHMVGMSQYGADYMARQGSDFEEILKYYYSNVEIL